MGTLQQNGLQVSALNDLIRINNDRIAGYKKRMDVMMDDDLDELFSNLISQSRKNIDELTEYIYLLGGKLADSNTLPGSFYHSWMDNKSGVSRQSRSKMLEYCSFGENVAKSAYQKVLADRDILSGNKMVVKLLQTQLEVMNIYIQTYQL